MVESRTSAHFSLASSTADDTWHALSGKEAYEWWYFDALSDDGRDALVVIFLDNFVFSPRYNKLCSHSKKSLPSETRRFPAVAFFHYRDGRPLYRCINEFDTGSFSASRDRVRCTIGDSGFEVGAAPYGGGYRVTVRGLMQGGRRLEADLEWVSLESDLGIAEGTGSDDAHNWNLVAPRADVTGTIRILDAAGTEPDLIDFRGTGYHDHNRDTRWLPSAVRRWQWGRVHFDDCTAVFYDFEPLEGERVSRLVTVRDGSTRVDRVRVVARLPRRDVFGLSYPSSVTFLADDGLSLTVMNRPPVDSSFFYLRHVNEAVLKHPDGVSQTGRALTELLVPKALRYRWLDWLVDMRIGRGGKGAFLP